MAEGVPDYSKAGANRVTKPAADPVLQGLRSVRDTAVDAVAPTSAVTVDSAGTFSSVPIGTTSATDVPTWGDVQTEIAAVAAPLAHTHSGADITSGTVAAARLGSGTADATTYLRGDGTWATPAGGPSSGNAGVTTIDFGAFPGGSDATVTVIGQTGIVAGSVVQAWLVAQSTIDHTADEHRVETIGVTCGNIVANTSFDIYAQNTSQLNEPVTAAGISSFRSAAATVYGYAGDSIGGRGTRIYGAWTVHWRWS